MPGSSAFASTVAMWRTDSGLSAAPASAASTSWSISSAGAPRLAPTPTTSDGGRSTAVRPSRSTCRSVTSRRATASPSRLPRSTEGRRHVRRRCRPHVRRQCRQWPGGVGFEPDGLTVEHRAADRGDGAFDRPAEGVQAGDVSRVGRGGDDRLGTEHVGDPLGQLVRAGPGRVPATVPEFWPCSRLCPCPPSSGTAHLPASSTATTAGSASLLSSSGAMRRTVAPAARKHTSASHSCQARGTAAAAGPS